MTWPKVSPPAHGWTVEASDTELVVLHACPCPAAFPQAVPPAWTASPPLSFSPPDGQPHKTYLQDLA